jgi:hypothetical protein
VAEQGELYVGYLAVPAGVKRFLRIAVPVVLWIVAIAAVVVARTQPTPGMAVWESTEERQVTGVLTARPYPMLYVSDRGDGRAGYVLLVEVGKHGGGKRAAGFDGKHISVSGWMLHRDGRFMLEMAPGEGAIREVQGGSARAEVERKSLGRVTLRGEIVDSKCFLGAMKPGHGKTHKECATLCISGGIPPMFVVRGAGGMATYYLLTNEEGGPLGSEAWAMIADPVEVSGELEEVGGMKRLRVRAGDIRRL